MRTLYLILYIIAALCFAVSAFRTMAPVTNDGVAQRVQAVDRVNWIALGLLAWVLVPLIATIDILAD